MVLTLRLRVEGRCRMRIEQGVVVIAPQEWPVNIKRVMSYAMKRASWRTEGRGPMQGTFVRARLGSKLVQKLTSEELEEKLEEMNERQRRHP